jgi:hypothetical protein
MPPKCHASLYAEMKGLDDEDIKTYQKQEVPGPSIRQRRIGFSCS